LRPLLPILFATFLLPWASQGAGKSADSTKKSPPKPSAPTPSAPRVAWKPEYHLRRAYVPMAQVASYYGLLEPKESGRQIILRDASSKLRIEFTRSEKAARIMGWTFYLSFPVVEIKDRPMVSVYDVRNVIDAILHPGERRDPAVLETIVLDPSGGGREIGIKTPHMTEKDLTLDVSNRLAAKLSAAGFKVVVTRKDDSTVSPADRQKTAIAVSGEAIFLSLRAASGSPATHGFETSTLPPAGTPATSESDSENIDKKFHAGNINDRESLALAAVLQSSVVSSLKIPDLGIRDGSPRFDCGQFGSLRCVLYDEFGVGCSKISDSGTQRQELFAHAFFRAAVSTGARGQIAVGESDVAFVPHLLLCNFGLELLQLGAFAHKRGVSASLHVGDERERLITRAGHAPGQHQIGEMRLP
jgi:N-acetylmuramoyl-L-alanine amidase